MKTSLPVLTFILRHFFFVVFVVGAACILWSLAYLVLLAIAVIFNQGAGGPLAYPAGMTLVITACVALGWGVFTPSSAAGSLFCRWFRLPKIAAIPVVWLAAFLFVYLISSTYVTLTDHHEGPSFATVLKHFALYLSVPLGVYWWITEGPGALFDTFRRWVQKKQRRRLSPHRAPNFTNQTNP